MKGSKLKLALNDGAIFELEMLEKGGATVQLTQAEQTITATMDDGQLAVLRSKIGPHRTIKPEPE